jgi:DNA (cytosine-5)-methyltransferase 1
MFVTVAKRRARNMQPIVRCLDLFCGAGGAGEGYRRAGFDVTGVDIRPQPHNPHRFIQADALAFLREHGHEFAFIHASPPCQRWSMATRMRPGAAATHPDLIAPVRELLLTCGKPWVSENVVGAPLREPLMLCGTMFGLKVYRHRLFESSFRLPAQPHSPHRDNCHGNHRISRNGFVNVFGGGGNTDYKRKAMGIDWMTRDELSQAIPPAYTEWIGREFLNTANDQTEGPAA